MSTEIVRKAGGRYQALINGEWVDLEDQSVRIMRGKMVLKVPSNSCDHCIFNNTNSTLCTTLNCKSINSPGFILVEVPKCSSSL